MNELSLFTGGGGGVLGTMLLGFRHIGYVEWDDYCQRVIRQRIDDGILHEAPIFGDIRAFISDGYAASYTGMVDVVTAGFPCQPFSVAGKRKGAEDERNIWPATRDVIRIVKPRLVLLENVPGIRRYLPVVIRDLRRLGYAVRRPLQLGADDVGAPHRRKRVWILANAECDGRRPRRPEREGQQGRDAFIGASDVADTECLWKLQPERGKCDERGRAGNGCKTLADTKIIRAGDECKDFGPCSGEIDTFDNTSGTSRGNDRPDNWENVADADKFHDDDARLNSGAICGERPKETEIQGCDVAHPKSISGGAGLRQSGPERDGDKSCDCGGDVADSLCSGREEQHPPDLTAGSGQHTGLSLVERGAAWWPTQPRLGGMVDGISNRVDLPCPFAGGSG